VGTSDGDIVDVERSEDLFSLGGVGAFFSLAAVSASVVHVTSLLNANASASRDIN